MEEHDSETSEKEGVEVSKMKERKKRQRVNHDKPRYDDNMRESGT